jgi:uncharacterized phage protein gp47/JayE
MMSHSEAFTYAMVEALAKNPKLSQETIETEGTTLNLICNMIADVVDEFAARANRGLEGVFLDTAEGDALTRLVVDRYGVQRHGETAAIVSLTLDRTGSAPAITMPAGAVFVTSRGVRFGLDAGFAWPSGDTDARVVSATALVTGPGGNVAAGQTWRLETSVGDATITAANSQAASRGGVEEEDADLKVRARGARDADLLGVGERIRKSALEVPGVREASVYEDVDGDGNPTGGGTLVISDGSGGANDTMISVVAEKIKDARPFGAYVGILGATVRLENVTVTAVWDPGKATAANAEALRQAIIARVNQLDPRAAPDDAEPEAQCLLTHAIIQEVRPQIEGLRRIVVTVPAGTVEPDQGEVIRPSVVTVA